MAELSKIEKWCQMDLEDLKPYVGHFSIKEFWELLLSDCETYGVLERLEDHFRVLCIKYADRQEDSSCPEQDKEAYAYCKKAYWVLGICRIYYWIYIKKVDIFS